MSIFLESDDSELSSNEITFLKNFASIPFTQGDLLYFDGSNINRLAQQSSGMFLMSKNPSNPIPTWAQITGDRIAMKSITGSNIVPDSILGSNIETSILGWQQDITFSSVDADTVAWTSGTLTLLNGISYFVNSGNTGDMSASTYIYLDINVSHTDLQTTTTATDAVGAGKIMIAFAKNSTNEALFQVYGGKGGIKISGVDLEQKTITATQIAADTITASEIATNTITANEIAANTITASQIAAGTVTTSELNFTPLYSSSGTGSVVATINASTEGIRIAADNITLAGTTTFTSGWAATANAESDINVLNTINAPVVAGADVTADSNFVTVTYPADQSDIQTQIDGKIISWFQADDPQPTWSGTDASHVGDIWWNTTSKKLKRWLGTAWSSDIEDQKAIDAYDNASTAQDTADGKRRVFTAEPTTPYDIGDLWSAGPAGDLKKCKIARTTGAYVAGDWELASNTTDGADWDSNLLNIPGTLDAPSGAGLYLSATNLGYYNSTVWKTYMDNSGNFYLGGTSGKLQWNAGTNVLTIQGTIIIDNPGDINQTSLANSASAGATVGATWGNNISNEPTALNDINSTEGTKLGGIANGADVTSSNTAASISGQGALATKSEIGKTDCDTTIISNGKIVTDLLTANNIITGTLDANNVIVTNLTASHIKSGTFSIGATNQPGLLTIIESSAATSGTSTSKLNWESTGGTERAKIWADSSGYMGYNAVGGNHYFYTANNQNVVIRNGLQTIFNQGISCLDAFNVGSPGGTVCNARFNGGYVYFANSGTSLSLYGGTSGTLAYDASSYHLFKISGSEELKISQYGLTTQGYFYSPNSTRMYLGPDYYVEVNGENKTAIVPTSKGYNALYCTESPEVWFMDFCDEKGILDPMFEEVTVGPYRYMKCEDSGYQVWGKRKGHENLRFESKTGEEFVANERFLNMNKPENQ